MASNPLRPQYQGTIESTWGQSVADHVIRRYPTAAARDADLAVLPPADLEGQVVALTGAGRPTFLEMKVGALWLGVLSGFDIQAASTHAGADANANARVTFPRAFGGVPIVVWSDASVNNPANNRALMGGAVVACDAAGFTVRCQGVDAQPVLNAGVQIAWIALYAGSPGLLRDESDESVEKRDESDDEAAPR